MPDLSPWPHIPAPEDLVISTDPLCGADEFDDGTADERWTARAERFGWTP